jgi:membrane-bound lytic murein transglycosylase B
MIRRATIAAAWLLFLIVSANADAAFQQWLQSLWPQAHELGVSRATFDAGIRGIEPNYSLPDLALPGRPEKQPQQPEFVQTPAQYLREATFQRCCQKALTARPF